jgi:HTH-type transcriptional regulator/antitoxin HigA
LDTGKREGELEKEADKWASEFLIPRHLFEDLTSDPPYSKAKIAAFAERIGIAPGIVVGRLQHEGEVPFARSRQTYPEMIFVDLLKELSDKCRTRWNP